MPRVKKIFIKSGKDKIYVEIGYPQKNKLPLPAIIIAHGLRSYYTGFLNMFAKRLRDSGYITVKFHFVGTGKSSGKFEDKTTKAMLDNYEKVIEFLKSRDDIKDIGIVGRSNAGSIATIHGLDTKIKAYVFLAPPAFYSKTMLNFMSSAKIKNGYLYHKSYKRPHTKGIGRLPLSFIDEIKKYDNILLENIKKIKPVIYFQSTEDEAVKIVDGHFDYWKENLPNPKKMVLIKGGNHSFKGRKNYVISEGIKWFKKYLPVS